MQLGSKTSLSVTHSRSSSIKSGTSIKEIAASIGDHIKRVFKPKEISQNNSTLNALSEDSDENVDTCSANNIQAISDDSESPNVKKSPSLKLSFHKLVKNLSLRKRKKIVNVNHPNIVQQVVFECPEETNIQSNFRLSLDRIDENPMLKPVHISQNQIADNNNNSNRKISTKKRLFSLNANSAYIGRHGKEQQSQQQLDARTSTSKILNSLFESQETLQTLQSETSSFEENDIAPISIPLPTTNVGCSNSFSHTALFEQPPLPNVTESNSKLANERDSKATIRASQDFSSSKTIVLSESNSKFGASTAFTESINEKNLPTKPFDNSRKVVGIKVDSILQKLNKLRQQNYFEQIEQPVTEEFAHPLQRTDSFVGESSFSLGRLSLPSLSLSASAKAKFLKPPAFTKRCDTYHGPSRKNSDRSSDNGSIQRARSYTFVEQRARSKPSIKQPPHEKNCTSIGVEYLPTTPYSWWWLSGLSGDSILPDSLGFAEPTFHERTTFNTEKKRPGFKRLVLAPIKRMIGVESGYDHEVGGNIDCCRDQKSTNCECQREAGSEVYDQKKPLFGDRGKSLSCYDSNSMSIKRIARPRSMFEFESNFLPVQEIRELNVAEKDSTETVQCAVQMNTFAALTTGEKTISTDSKIILQNPKNKKWDATERTDTAASSTFSAIRSIRRQSLVLCPRNKELSKKSTVEDMDSKIVFRNAQTTTHYKSIVKD